MGIVGWSLGQICLLWRRSVAFILYCGNVDSEHGNDNTRVQTIEWAVAVFSAALSLSLSPQRRTIFSISPSVKPCWQDTRVFPFISTSCLLHYLFSTQSQILFLRTFHFCKNKRFKNLCRILSFFFLEDKNIYFLSSFNLDLSQKLSSASSNEQILSIIPAIKSSPSISK